MYGLKNFYMFSNGLSKFINEFFKLLNAIEAQKK